MENTKKVPMLRFPEFTEDWEVKKFCEIFSFRTTNSFSRDNLNYDNGYIKNIHYGDIHTKFSTLFNITKEHVPFINSEIEIGRIPEDNYCKTGDLIITDASEDYDDIGKCIEIINLNNEKVLSGLHTILARPDLYKMYVGFSGYLMKSNNIHLQIKVIAQGTKVLSISSKRLSLLNLIVPKVKEQQKIANFLSQIDNKIEKLTNKKHLLESYKKGVMQKIFNKENRFKDDNGEDYSDWEDVELGDIITFSNGKAHENHISENGKYVVVNSKFVSSNGKVAKYSDSAISLLNVNDIVMVMSDVPNGKAIAKCFFIDEDDKYTLNQRICSLREKKVVNKFLFYQLNRNSYYLRFDNGVSQTNLRKDDVLSCPIKYPPSLLEQKKIANLLTEIDNKINFTEKQLNDTKKYKKGLLQKMFV